MLVVAAVWYTLVGASLGVVKVAAAASAGFRTQVELPDVCCMAVVNYGVEGIDGGRVTYCCSDFEEIVVATVVPLGEVAAAGGPVYPDGSCSIRHLV